MVALGYTVRRLLFVWRRLGFPQVSSGHSTRVRTVVIFNHPDWYLALTVGLLLGASLIAGRVAGMLHCPASQLTFSLVWHSVHTHHC